MTKTETYHGVEFDVRHGGPFDRGAADSYYGRNMEPHYYLGATMASTKIGKDGMTADELAAYYSGYYWNTDNGTFKEY